MSQENNSYLPQQLIKYWNEDQSTDNTNAHGIQKLLQSAYALNLCTVSVSRIINNRDKYVMNQEYDAILNNLNLYNMPNSDSLLKVLKEIMDVITFFKFKKKIKSG